jgi:hypothetical protein
MWKYVAGRNGEVEKGENEKKGQSCDVRGRLLTIRLLILAIKIRPHILQHELYELSKCTSVRRRSSQISFIRTWWVN